MRARVLIAARYAIGALLIYWLWRSGIVDWGALRARLLAWPAMLGAFAVLLLDLAVTSWRLVVLLRGGGFTITLRDAFRLSLVGNLFNLVLPAGGGDVARFYYASNSAAGRRTELAALVAFDRAVGLVTLLAMPVLLYPAVVSLAPSPLLTSLVAAAAATTVALTAGFALVIAPNDGVAAPLAWFLARLPWRRHVDLFVGALRSYRRHPGALVQAVLISLVAHALSAMVIALLHDGARTDSIFLVSVVSLLAFVANSLPLTPGGIGVGEAAFAVLFLEAGLSGGAEALLSWRLLLIALAPAGIAIHLRGLRITLSTLPR